MSQSTTETRAAASAGAEAREAQVGWSDPEIQHRIEWRDGDIVISVPVKSGTTWTMNIVHQLREGGDPDLVDVYREVPWLEFVPAPGVTREQRLASLDALPRDRRRAFKTHSAPGPLPYLAPEPRRDVKYVVVARNPEEAVASFYPFIAAHSDEWLALWQLPREAYERPTFDAYFGDIGKDIAGGALFGFLAAWWPLRHAPNVLLMHYSDMKRDHVGAVRKIAGFLGFEPPADRWPTILECTSFRWMKAHEHKFELRTVGAVPVLKPGGMVRRGQTGAAAEDGMTPAISAEIARIGREVLRDDAAFEWFYRGGPLPR